MSVHCSVSSIDHSEGRCPEGTQALQLFDGGERNVTKIATLVQEAFPEWHEKNPNNQVRIWLKVLREFE